MRTWVITAIAIKPEAEAKRTMAEFADVPRKCQSMFAPKCHNCTMCHAFKMQPELHNSADRGIFKFVYLRLRLVVCFYPRPPAWPWSWGYAYLYLPYVVQSYHFASMVVISIFAPLRSFREYLALQHICSEKSQEVHQHFHLQHVE